VANLHIHDANPLQALHFVAENFAHAPDLPIQSLR
jgi:hypothetical protein